MSLEKIVQTALAEQPIEMKEAFDEAMKERIAAALEEKYKKMTKESEVEDDEDEDESEEDEDDEDEDKDE